MAALNRAEAERLYCAAALTSCTIGGLQHLTAERFRRVSGAKLNMIHYPGTEAALGDVISGRVPVMFQTILPVAGALASGAVRMLAIASDARLPDYPDIPTASETVTGFTSSGWSIMVAPHGTPAAIVRKVNADLHTALARPEVVSKFKAKGDYTRTMSPQQLADYIRTERGVWGPFVQEVSAAAQ